MTAALNAVMALSDQFKAAMQKGDAELDLCQKLMGQIKVAMLDFTSLPPAMVASPSPTQQKELLLAREVLEQGALLSIKVMDISAFERYVAQLKIYYADCAAMLPESPRRFPILGLNLLRLLSQNRIAEFHTELETIPPELQATNVYIKYPAQLEQHIMEGSYNKVLSAKQDGLFSQEGMYFMDQLVDTVRDEIAECAAKAYTSIGAADLQTLLMITSQSELVTFVEERGWHIDGKTVSFAAMEAEPSAQKLPSSLLIQQTLSYAKELERIV